LAAAWSGERFFEEALEFFEEALEFFEEAFGSLGFRGAWRGEAGAGCSG
jgi:hypothetical protein